MLLKSIYPSQHTFPFLKPQQLIGQAEPYSDLLTHIYTKYYIFPSYSTGTKLSFTLKRALTKKHCILLETEWLVMQICHSEAFPSLLVPLQTAFLWIRGRGRESCRWILTQYPHYGHTGLNLHNLMSGSAVNFGSLHVLFLPTLVSANTLPLV